MGLISVSMVTSSGLMKDLAFLGCCWVVETGGGGGLVLYFLLLYILPFFNNFFFFLKYPLQRNKEVVSQTNAMPAAYWQRCCSLGGAPGQLSSPKHAAASETYRGSNAPWA